MSRVMEQLRTDHVNIARLISLLDLQMGEFDRAGAPDFELMTDILDYALNYPELCHHPTEDLVYQRLMERDPASSAVVLDLLEEHRKLTLITKEFADLLARVVLDGEVPRERLGALGREFVATNRRHIEREETIVFPLAEKALTDQDWAEIDAAISADDPLFGAEVADQFRALYQSIVELPPEPD
jgi:hemerythrin-like domain-containing protein